MKRALVASVLAFAMVGLVGAGSAFAQKKGAKPAAADSGNKVKNYDFSGDNIEGELIKPDGEMVNSRKFAEHTSLIRVRQDFIKEIVKSADNI
jgi:cytochrome oxidase Cu insertion factor (SCO1/SenC/PrrC family)